MQLAMGYASLRIPIDSSKKPTGRGHRQNTVAGCHAPQRDASRAKPSGD
jgi:hypothetical protein